MSTTQEDLVTTSSDSSQESTQQDSLQSSMLQSSLSDPLIAPSPEPEPEHAEKGVRTREAALEAGYLMPTWDEKAFDSDTGKKGLWVDAAADRDSDLGSALMKNGEYGDHRMVAGLGNVDEPTGARAERAKAGTLTEDDLDNITLAEAQYINPLGAAPKRLLQGLFKSSWTKAIHDTVGEGDGPEMVMTKLWEFRQWHHEKLLNDTKDFMDAREGKYGAGALTGWAAAGSTTLTSDIDVNMKGANTEAAVEVFNKLFKKDGWSYEAGVVYDVNVYAMDFMFGKTFGDGVEDGQGNRVSAKEGSREGLERGGFSTYTGRKGRQGRLDTGKQEVWSLVKMRLYMNEAEWTAYQKEVDPSKTKLSMWQDVDRKVASYRDTLLDEMKVKKKDFATLAVKTDSAMAQIKAAAGGGGDFVVPEDEDEDEDAAKDNRLMTAQNRVYEKKLKKIHLKRVALGKKIAKYDTLVEEDKTEAAEALDGEINTELKVLREMVSEAALYSNEAYVTDAAVQHTVVGLQQGIPIKQTKSESFQAANENVGDTLKELDRHGNTLGEAVYKGGKYLWRMADAITNMGAGTLTDVATFAAVGKQVATVIKKDANLDGAQKQQAAATLAQTRFGLSAATRTGVDELMGKVRGVAANLGKWYRKKVDRKQKQQDVSETVGTQT